MLILPSDRVKLQASLGREENSPESTACWGDNMFL